MDLSQYLVTYRPVCKMWRSHVTDTKISHIILLVNTSVWSKLKVIQLIAVELLQITFIQIYPMKSDHLLLTPGNIFLEFFFNFLIQNR